MLTLDLWTRLVRGVVTALVATVAVATWSGSVTPAWGAAVLVAGAVAVVVVALRDPVGLKARPRGGAATLVVARTALVVLGGGLVVDEVGTSLTASLVAVAVLVVGAEPLVLRVARARRPWAAHLPGVPDTTSRGWGLVWLLPSSLVGPLAAAAVVLGAPGATWWVATLLGMVHVVALTVRGVVTQVRSPRLRRAVLRAVRKYDPEFIVYTSRPDDASYQVKMWLPYLERTGRRYVVVAWTPEAAGPLAELTTAPVVVRASNKDLDGMLSKSLGAVFYVNASSGNNAMVRYSQLTHVYLGHGDSDKPPSYNPTHAMYDQVFAAGQGAIDRYPAHGVHISPERFVVVGRPQVEDIDVIDPHAATRGGTPTVLYAPTWRGHVAETALQSLHLGERIVAALLERGARVVFRPHPFSYAFPEDAATIERVHTMLAAHRQTTGTEHLWGSAAEKERSIVECINESDAMVSDVSSVVSDYLFSRKPFAMMAISAPVDRFVDEYPVARGAYVVDAELEGLEAALDAMLGQDPLAEQRTSVRNYYLGDFEPEGYADHFVQAASRAIDNRVGASRGDERDEEPNDTDDAAADDAEAGVAAEAATPQNELVARVRGILTRPSTKRAVDPVRNVVLAALAAWLLLVDAPVAVVLVAALLAATAILERPVTGLVTDVPLRRSVGADAGAWVVLLAAAAHQVEAGAPAAWGIALAALAAATGAETLALQLWRGADAKNLPGMRVDMQQAPASSAVAVVLAVVAALVATFASVVAAPLDGTTGWLVLALGVAAAASAVVAFVAAALQAFRSRADGEQLRELVIAYAPQFAVYFASNGGARYQYGMWEDYFRRIDRKYVVVTRTPAMARQIAELTDAPVIYRQTLRSLDDVDVPSLSTVFYVNNATRNTHMVERPELTNVWLNHGDSEKPACFNPVHGIYHYIFAAGQAGIDRYARHGVSIPREKFMIVGRPQVELISAARGPVAGLSDRTVLYAPTWVGPYKDTEVYSLPVGEELVRRLLQRDVRVIFRAHPLNYGQDEGRALVAKVQQILAQDARETGREHLWGPAAEEDMSVEDCFNASDAMVCDVSAVVSDYLKSGKPMAIMSMDRTVEQIVEEVPAARAAYIVPGDLAGLDERLDELLGEDPLAGARTEMMKYYLGDFPDGDYASGFLEAARMLIDRGRRRS